MGGGDKRRADAFDTVTLPEACEVTRALLAGERHEVVLAGLREPDDTGRVLGAVLTSISEETR